MKELGEYLKETRENHGVSINEAAEDLDIEVSELENMEQGNIRAFKDVFTLKSLVRNYAKYLGLEPEKVLDEFNDFLFEHTSKICIEDILAAQNKKPAPKKKIMSPYTKIKAKKINIAPIVLAILVCILVILILYLLLRNTSNEPVIDRELKPILSREVFYEFA